MATMVEELLRAWREGERVLETLPAKDRESADVAEAVAVIRLEYQRLTDAENMTPTKLRGNRRTIKTAFAVIDRALDRIDRRN